MDTPAGHVTDPDADERVYVIAGHGTSLVKIGRSRNVQQRLSTLQSMSPLPLRLVCTFSGGPELEAALHRYFEAQRTHGEWFDLPSADPAAVVSAAVASVSPAASKGKRRPSKPVDHFKVDRFVPTPDSDHLFAVDPHQRRVGAWPTWIPTPRGSRLVSDPFTCRCQHPIGAHNAVRPHHCAFGDAYDADWCICFGYEGPLPPQLTGYDLPGHDWRFWRSALLPPTPEEYRSMT
ncbi:GIY-YIG nuclease family protein [Streptomyces chartreusis]|uniref:GIY-YIG nuclease family protein n=1 Tax=Streptomyces chartreusis TaxID=1969 RepID=UPI0033AC1D95